MSVVGSCFVTSLYAGLGGVVCPSVVSLIVAGLLLSLAFRLRILWLSYDDVYRDQSNNKGQ